MKKLIVVSLFLTSFAFAQENQTGEKPTPESSKKMTTKDAKKSCKDEGKTGADLIKCMKEKKEEK